MIIPHKTAVNKNKRRGWVKILIIPLSALLILSGTLAAPVSASTGERPDNTVGCYAKDGKTCGLYIEDMDTFPAGTTPAQIEKMFPMSKEAEKAIVHVVPECPFVIIDGIKYKSTDISLFDGVRLRFVNDAGGNLYAFTTVEGLENFQKQHLTKQSPVQEKQDPYVSEFWPDILYGGEGFELIPGRGQGDLSITYFDNCISSVKVSTLAAWACLYDYPNYQGDSFLMYPGSNHSILALEGWNDRASSVYVAQ
jgi:hypothetical protein